MKQRINILWLSHLVPYPPKGGVLQRSFNLIKEASKQHNIYLLAFNQKGLLPMQESVLQAVRELENYCKTVEVLDIPSEELYMGRYWLYVLSLFTTKPFTINWLRSRRMQDLIEKVVITSKIGLIHFDTISLAPFARAVTGYKRVLNHHNVESDMMIRRSERELNIVKKIYMYQEGCKIRSYEKSVCGLFDLNITCSSVESELLMNLLPELKAEVIPNGVDVKHFYPLKEKKEECSLVFAGAMNWYQNRSAMIFFCEKVWPLLKADIPNIKMTVIGADPPEQLLRLARRDRHFKVTGFVDDVRPYIHKAMVYVCPIKDSGGTKIKILDALAMGKAIVADPVSCVGIDVVDGESVMFAVHPKDYVERIKLLVTNNNVVETLGRNGRMLILRKYSYSDIGKTLCHLYQSIAEG